MANYTQQNAEEIINFTEIFEENKKDLRDSSKGKNFSKLTDEKNDSNMIK